LKRSGEVYRVLEEGDMQKIIASIIISVGLIISAVIISNSMEKTKSIGRYHFYIAEAYTTGNIVTPAIYFKVDTSTGDVWYAKVPLQEGWHYLGNKK